MQTIDWYWIELLSLDNNTWNHLNVYKQMNSDSFWQTDHLQIIYICVHVCASVCVIKIWH